MRPIARNGGVAPRRREAPAHDAPPVLFAHRGASALAPENTLEAFALALRLGATGLESDVHLALGGEPVLVHDPTVTTPAGARLVVTETPVAALRRLGIPTLSALYAACGTSWPLSLDLNDARALETALAVVAAARSAGRDAVAALRLCHTEVGVLSRIRRVADDVVLVHSARSRLGDDPGGYARRLAAGGIQVLNRRQDAWTAAADTAEAIRSVHEAGCLAFAWDTQVAPTARRLIEAGVDGVYGDDPRELVAALAGWGEG